MKNFTTLKLVLTLLVFIYLPGVYSQTAIYTIYNPNYGELYMALELLESYEIDKLKIEGNINAADIRTIRDYLNELIYLDLSGVNMYDNEIPSWGFEYHNKLEEILLPDNITQIREYAFYQCESLKRINLPMDLEIIRENAFAYCSSLSGELNFRSNIITIRERAFYYCSSLSGELLLPSTLEYIGYDAFQGCPGLTHCKTQSLIPPIINSESLGDIRIVFVPEGSAENYRIADYWSQMVIINGDTPLTVEVKLTQAGTLGEKILEQVSHFNLVQNLIVSGPFNSTDWSHVKNMTSLLSIDLTGTDLTNIPDSQFEGNNYLMEVFLPETITHIGEQAFRSCGNLSEISFPEKLISIGRYAFYYCSSLKSIIIPERVTQIEDYTFGGCGTLENVYLSDNIISIGSSSFRNCYLLKSIVLPSKLEKIEYEAFYYTALESISLPANLSIIGYSAFGRSNLKQIICQQPTPPVLNNDPFYYNDKTNCELIVPSWTEISYKLADYWREFTNVSTYEYELEDLPISGTLTFSETIRPSGVPSVTIQPGGILNVRGSLPFQTNNFVMKQAFNFNWSNGFNSSVFSNLVNESPFMSAETVQISSSLPGNRWIYLSFPFDVNMNEVSIDEEKFFVFRKYDGATRALSGAGSSWKNVESDEILESGQGYIFQASGDIEELILMATENSKELLFSNSVRQITLTDYISENKQDESWNLVGNPFPSYFDIAYMDYIAPITIWNGSSYEAISIVDDEYILRPLEAFFVQKPADIQTINFLPAGRQSTSEFLERSQQSKLRSQHITDNRKILNLYLENEDYTDKCRIVINPEAKLEYEITRDAAKFMSTEETIPQLYSLDFDGISYAINERPEEDGVIKLGMYVGKTDIYSISLDSSISADIEVILLDKEKDLHIDLKERNYFFYLDKGTYNNRFELFVNSSDFPGTTGVSNDNEIETKVISGKEKVTLIAPVGSNIQILNYSGFILKEISNTVESITEISLSKGGYIININGKAYKVMAL